jgi:succinate dehydrogenase/fumarate reductase-like Fe-S protein
MELLELLESIEPEQYGTSMHYPYCRSGKCTGCLPAVRFNYMDEIHGATKFDLSIFRKDV